MATGARPRALPGTEGMPGVHVLRTLDDCLAIRAGLESAGPGARVVVIGAGFIGSEVAATCHGLGARVTVVEALPTPLARVLGHRDGRGLCAAPPGPRGQPSSPGWVWTGSRPTRRTVAAVVHLADGTGLEADVVVVGIGVVPAVEWLADSGLSLDNGVVCTETLFAADEVVAAGDVARWTRPGYRREAAGRALDQRRRGGRGRRPATCWPGRRRPSPTIPCPSSGRISTRPRSR